MFGGRTRYGLPVILYHWIVGTIGILIVILTTIHSPFPTQPTPLLAFSLFLIMHIIASFLHFQYTRMNVVITFESSFTTATLLVFGSLPAVWISVVGIFIGSVKRLIEHRWIQRKPIPLSYDLGIIVLNCGMIGTMWIAASWIYFGLLHSELPLTHLTIRNILCIIVMFIGLSLLNHIFLFFSSYLRGEEPLEFTKKALLPAFLTEFAAIPFGVVMALTYTRMGELAFLFFSTTLLLSNAVLRRLSSIRNDLEEKLRHLTTLNRVSKKIISLQQEENVMNLLPEELSSVAESDSWFLAKVDEWKNLHILKEKQSVRDSLMQLASDVVRSTHPILISNTNKEGPAGIREALLKDGIRSCIVVPLIVGEKPYGVLGVYSAENSAFKHEHMQVLIMVADEAALALENSNLYNALTAKLSELEHVNTELRQLDRLKSQFLANVSHELRTPLTSIKGYVEYIKKEKLGPITPMQSEGLRVAQRNILRLQRLINDLLDYTKLEFNKGPIQIRPCNFEDLWKEVYEQFSEVIEKRNFLLQLRISPDLPLLFVDGPRFTQVLINLLGNAIKFSNDKGTITIGAQSIHHPGPFFRPEAYGNNCMNQTLVPVEITITDEGIGIPPEAIPRIFDRFYQVDSSNTRKYGGTGLGLALVKSILDAHGIPIEVQSKVGCGSSFGMVVPSLNPADLTASSKSQQLETLSSAKYLT
jgi:signal transduction histidine kinase